MLNTLKAKIKQLIIDELVTFVTAFGEFLNDKERRGIPSDDFFAELREFLKKYTGGDSETKNERDARDQGPGSDKAETNKPHSAGTAEPSPQKNGAPVSPQKTFDERVDAYTADIEVAARKKGTSRDYRILDEMTPQPSAANRNTDASISAAGRQPELTQPSVKEPSAKEELAAALSALFDEPEPDAPDTAAAAEERMAAKLEGFAERRNAEPEIPRNMPGHWRHDPGGYER